VVGGDKGVAVREVYTGGTKVSGHTPLLDDEGVLWLAGCDK